MTLENVPAVMTPGRRHRAEGRPPLLRRRELRVGRVLEDQDAVRRRQADEASRRAIDMSMPVGFWNVGIV